MLFITQTRVEWRNEYRSKTGSPLPQSNKIVSTLAHYVPEVQRKRSIMRSV